MKKFRKKAFDEIETSELNLIVSKIDSLLQETIDQPYQNIERSKMFVNTRYFVNEVIAAIRTKSIEQTISDIENMRPLKNTNDLILNDPDRVYLLQYYGDLLSGISGYWAKLIEIVVDLREQELMTISENELAIESMQDQKLTELLPLSLSDIRDVVLEARSILKSESDFFPQPFSRPSIDEIKKIKELVSTIKHGD